MGIVPFFESPVFRAHDPGIPKVDQFTFAYFRKHFTLNPYMAELGALE